MYNMPATILIITRGRVTKARQIGSVFLDLRCDRRPMADFAAGRDWVIDSNDVALKEEIGRGSFGTVHRGSTFSNLLP